MRTTSGPVLEKAGNLVGILQSLGPGAILFIDEIHRLRPQLEEFLYPAMEDFRIDVKLMDGTSSQTLQLPIERFTLVGATTRFGLLTPPMRARFGLVERLSFYSPDDLAQSSPGRPRTRGTDLRPGSVRDRRRARGRRAWRTAASSSSRFAEVRADGNITSAVAGEALSRLNVDEFGSTTWISHPGDHLEKFDGGPVGLSTIAASAGIHCDPRGGVRAVPAQQGFLERTPRGRVATANAYRPRDGAATPRMSQQSLPMAEQRRTADFDFETSRRADRPAPSSERGASRLLTVARLRPTMRAMFPPAARPLIHDGQFDDLLRSSGG